MPSLELHAQDRGEATIISLTGELDISSAVRVERELSRVEGREPALLVLDLSGLAFMDSTGLRVVVSADARARERGAQFVVVRGPDAVQRVFHLTRLEERLEMVDQVPPHIPN